MSETQIVYVLTNSAMPGLVKIGMTNSSEIENRLKQLYTTGVPVPFKCEFACKVKDADTIENALHFAFSDFRINLNREFFKISHEKIIAVLKHMEVNEVTTEVNSEMESEVDREDIRSAEKLRRSRRPTMRFQVLGIPIGARLEFKDGSKIVTVVSDRNVDFDGAEMSLTMATRRVLKLPDDYPLQPSPYWIYNNKQVYEIYEEYYSNYDSSETEDVA